VPQARLPGRDAGRVEVMDERGTHWLNYTGNHVEIATPSKVRQASATQVAGVAGGDLSPGGIPEELGQEKKWAQYTLMDSMRQIPYRIEII
jgi:hypothetical protein